MKRNGMKISLAAVLGVITLCLAGCGNAASDSIAGVGDADSNSANGEMAETQTAGETEEQGEANQVVVIEAAPALSFEGSSAMESELYVEPVAGMTDEFLRGVDISSYLAEIESGVVYKDFDGNVLDEEGFFTLLAQSGVNSVRIRVWNDPYDKEGKSYGGGNNDIQTAVKLGQWATKAGLQVCIDFHYSDFWADPGKQKSPKEWAHYTIEDKQQALYEYTKESLNILLDAGVNVTMVQLGNETNNGMSSETKWERISSLMVQGSKAVREVSGERDKDILIAVHFTNPEKKNYSFYADTLKEAGLDYDVFASSYYPFWHGTLENLTNELTMIAETYDKKVMVAETSYVYTDADGDGSGNSVSTATSGIVLDYDISVQGQANEVRDVMEAVVNVGEKGIGLFYWEPAWIPVQVYDAAGADAATVLAENKAIWEEKGSGWAASYASKYDPNDAGKYYGGSSWDNQALFDFEGNPLESLNVFKYVFGGTTAELSVVKVNPFTYESGIGQQVQMPETVPALLNNGKIKEIPAIWNEEQVSVAENTGAGAYTIEGVATDAGVEYDVICNLEIKKVNYIRNFGFEEADMSMWNIDGAGIDKEMDNNKRTGDYSLKFWSADPVSYTVEQEIVNLPAGTYEMGAYLQGGDAGSNAVFELYIKIDEEELTAPTKVTSWQQWDNPVISDIQIPDGAKVVVGVRANAAAGAWGAWDDFYLYEAE